MAEHDRACQGRPPSGDDRLAASTRRAARCWTSRKRNTTALRPGRWTAACSTCRGGRGAVAQEIGERVVTVNAVIPTATDGAGYFTESKADDPLRQLVQKASPLGSRMGAVDDVADTVEFFTGKLTRWISGQQLLVSGGALS